MEAFFEALGWTAIVLLVIIGLVSGAIAGKLVGRNRVLYLAVGVLGALALPVLLVGLGVGLLAAGGLAAILFVSVLGAVLLILLVRALFGRTAP